MIYLIDDKKPRQELLGWNRGMIDKYENILKPIYTYKQIEDENLNSQKEIFSANSIVLFHESFFDSVTYANRKNSLEVRNKLNQWLNDKNIPLVSFSGSIRTRESSDNRASVPVEILYQNLDLFLKSYLRQDTIAKSLKFLLFGEKFNIEQILLVKKQIWETEFVASPLLDKLIEEYNQLTNGNIPPSATLNNPYLLKILVNG